MNQGKKSPSLTSNPPSHTKEDGARSFHKLFLPSFCLSQSKKNQQKHKPKLLGRISPEYLANIRRAPPDVGLVPSAAWRALPLHPLRLRPLPPPHQPGPPPPKASQKSGRGGWGGKGCGLREGSSSYDRGGRGGLSKRQLGPDPHLGALDWISRDNPRPRKGGERKAQQVLNVGA